MQRHSKALVYTVLLLWNLVNLYTTSSSCRTSIKNTILAPYHLKHGYTAFLDANLTYDFIRRRKGPLSALSSSKLEDNIPPKGDLLVKHVHGHLTQNCTVDPSIVVDRVSRLEYNKDTILETVASAITADQQLTGNNLEEAKGTPYHRFDGDEGIERKLVAAKHVSGGSELLILPRRYCMHLSKIKDDLIASYHAAQLQAMTNATVNEYANHIRKLSSHNIGCFLSDTCKLMATAKQDTANSKLSPANLLSTDDATIHNATDIKQPGAGFHHRLADYMTLKRLQLLRTLLIADSIISTGDIISSALSSKEIAIAYLNRNERELLLLSLSMATDYYLALVSIVLRWIHDPDNMPELDTAENLKISWTHHYLTKDMEHLPMLLSEPGLKQLQEPVLRYRMRQRHLACCDMINIASDPLAVVQDRIESLAQSHYKIEDTMPTTPGCGPLMDNRKIQAEVSLESIEAELISFAKQDDLEDSSGLFNVARAALDNILGNSQAPLLNSDESTDSPDLLQFFEQYLTGDLPIENYRHISKDAWLNALNCFMTKGLFTKLMAAVVSHNIRQQTEAAKEASSDHKARAFLHHGAPGISTEPREDAVDEVKLPYHEAYIAPMIDLCNNGYSDHNAIIETTEDEESKFVLKAIRDIAPGEEITVNYGDMDNNVLMLDYGIVPRMKYDKGVVMDVEPGAIRNAAASRNVAHLLPKYFPAGLAPEKREMLAKFNMIDIPSDKNFLSLYNNPSFQGLPVQQYNEFYSKFMTREEAKHPLSNTAIDPYAMKQEKSEYEPITFESFITEEPEQKEPMKLIKVDFNGVPDERLIPVLKICFCKTKKRIQWLAQQEACYLSTSINSPLDIEVFKVASLVCCEYYKTRYQRPIVDDLRLLFNPELTKITHKFGFSTLGEIRNCNNTEIPNAMLLAHALRAKIPLYRCATYFDKVAKDFEEVRA